MNNRNKKTDEKLLLCAAPWRHGENEARGTLFIHMSECYTLLRILT